MRREFPLMPAMVRAHEQFFEAERDRVETEYYRERNAKAVQPKRRKVPYEQRVRARFAAKRGVKC